MEFESVKDFPKSSRTDMKAVFERLRKGPIVTDVKNRCLVYSGARYRGLKIATAKIDGKLYVKLVD